jgi:hypothetical protein
LSGIRLYIPDGSPGVNGTNDWQENVDEVMLQVGPLPSFSLRSFLTLLSQRPRWYPTAAMLANGSILVIGGEIGSNDVNQANLEILPRPGGPNAGDTVVDLPWLEDVNELESYPFVFVLPSGRLFVG